MILQRTDVDRDSGGNVVGSGSDPGYSMLKSFGRLNLTNNYQMQHHLSTSPLRKECPRLW